MPPSHDQRIRDAITLIDLFIKDNAGDRLRHVESRRLAELRAVLSGHETLRSLAERARAENRRRAARAERLLRLVPARLRTRVVDCFR